MAEMTVEQLLEEIEVYVDNARSTGVLGSGGMVKINREELLAMLDEVRSQLPRELSESRQIMKTRDSIIADARAKADRIINDAAKEAGTLVDQNEVVSLARMRAEEIETSAEDEAYDLMKKTREESHALQVGALEYTQEMMDGLESMYVSIIEEEKKFFASVLDKLQEDHKHIRENKSEIDLQLGASSRSGRSKEDFETEKKPDEDEMDQ